MSTSAATILAHLKSVEAERSRRAGIEGLEAKVAALKSYQQVRFSHTYADLLVSARYGPAARFFLDELYGPSDFTQRDAQFARVVPALVRLFPSEIVDTVATLAALHALSESLDTEMAMCITRSDVEGPTYISAWQSVGREPDRLEQISLTLDVASRLDRFTQRALLRHSLRLMRGPAHAAGLGDLQRFLETGFDTFRAMNGSREFTESVSARERALTSALFAATLDDPTDPSVSHALSKLPIAPNAC